MYKTGNTVPSNDMRDLADNAQTLDEIIHSANDIVQTRTGRHVQTATGFERRLNAAIQSGPVTSVNGKRGEVKLHAEDVGALTKENADKIYMPKDYQPPVTSVNGKRGDVTLDAASVGALAGSASVFHEGKRILYKTSDRGFQSDGGDRPYLEVFAEETINNDGSRHTLPALMSFHRSMRFWTQFGLGEQNEFVFGGLNEGKNIYRFWTEKNTTVDANGFIKRASPIVKLFGNGKCELNNESQGVTTKRISEGVYLISGALGFHSDNAWHIEVPHDENGQRLIWVDYDIERNGDIKIQTFHQTHTNAPKFAQNELTTHKNGDPIDIPKGRWVDLRVQMGKEPEIIKPEYQEGN